MASPSSRPTADLPTVALDGLAIMVNTNAVGPKVKAPREVPEVIAGYRRIRPLGVGGMGEVHLARHERLGRDVALKLLRATVADDVEFAQRFLRESKAMAAVTHPNVVAIHDAGEIDGFLFMAIEFVDGTDLQKLLRTRGTIDEATAIKIMIGCCRGLEAINAAGLVHRDIKPANIFLDRTGEAKIGDLGLARHVDGEDRMTMTGAAWGTPAYMPPEQLRGIADIDIRCDVYALGATLFTILTGREPFTGPTSFVVTSKILSEPAPDPRQLNRTVSAPLAAIVRACLTKERGERYQNPQALRLDLERARDGLPLLIAQVVGAQPAVAAPVAGAQPRRGPAGAPPVAPSGLPGLDPFIVKILIYGVAAGLLALVVWSLQGQTKAERAAPAPQVIAGQLQTAAVSRPWMASEGRDAIGPWARLVVGKVEARLRYLPAERSFIMGSPIGEPDRQANEQAHPVTLSTGAWIADTEVAQGLWAAVTGSELSGDPARPVTDINWHEAREFLAALNQRLPGLNARLPTEAEWECACRAGTTTAFASGPVPDASEWLAQPGQGPRAVGSGRPNRFGLFDLHGNVREWCSDCFDRERTFTDSAETDPENRFGAQMVVRGGSSELPVARARSAARAGADPQERAPDMGFRFLVPER